MANLDSRAKRASAIGIDFNWNHIYPNPDGTIGQLDRQQVGYKYAGISASSGGGGSSGGRRTLLGIGL